MRRLLGLIAAAVVMTTAMGARADPGPGLAQLSELEGRWHCTGLALATASQFKGQLDVELDDARSRYRVRLRDHNGELAGFWRYAEKQGKLVGVLTDRAGIASSWASSGWVKDSLRWEVRTIKGTLLVSYRYVFVRTPTGLATSVEQKRPTEGWVRLKHMTCER